MLLLNDWCRQIFISCRWKGKQVQILYELVTVISHEQSHIRHCESGKAALPKYCQPGDLPVINDQKAPSNGQVSLKWILRVDRSSFAQSFIMNTRPFCLYVKGAFLCRWFANEDSKQEERKWERNWQNGLDRWFSSVWSWLPFVLCLFLLKKTRQLRWQRNKQQKILLNSRRK